MNLDAFDDAERHALSEALDALVYWELSDPEFRYDGHVREPYSNSKGKALGIRFAFNLNDRVLAGEGALGDREDLATLLEAIDVYLANQDEDEEERAMLKRLRDQLREERSRPGVEAAKDKARADVEAIRSGKVSPSKGGEPHTVVQPSMDAVMNDLHKAFSKASGRARDYERHVHTLLGFLQSVHSRFPGGEAVDASALSETALLVCTSIARDVGFSGSFTPRRKTP